jgi:L-iditol 2-dehydrogenase
VLVIGAGPIGLLFCQLARCEGRRVVVSDPLPERRAVARELGAGAALDPRATDVPAALREQTEGRGADLAVVAVADPQVVATAMASVRPAGKVLLFAQTRLGEQLAVDAGQVCMLEKALVGSYSADIDLQAEAAGLVFSRRVRVAPMITHRFPLPAIAQALDLAARPREGSMKVVVEP